MKTQEQLLAILTSLISGWEGECVEFKEAGDGFSTSDIGKYFSALSNEANLRARSSAWLVFGVRNSTRKVVGTSYRPDRERLHGLKQQIADGCEPSTTFREIHELQTEEGRVILFEIPPAPRGIPIGWQTHHYARNGESLTGLSFAKLDEIRSQSVSEDWSAIICREATLDDLDPEALTKARAVFISKHSDSIPEATILSWDTPTFLDKARLTLGGGITRACLLLVGREQATGLLNPYVAEMSWKLEGPELAYEHFHPPFLLSTTRLFQRVRNLRLSFLPANQLMPVDVSKYDQRIVLEALHNCIVHQDYTRRERILVIERQSELVFQNAGNFFDGTPREYVLHNRTPTRYRNRFLAEAMLQLRMIDTMGFGIREIMFRGQANRYLPMPDYDETGPAHVIMRLQGRFIDENYSRALLTHADLSWTHLLGLDSIQKGREIDEDTVSSLRNQKLVEGRRPHLRVAWHIAANTEDQVDYIHRKAFDDEYYRDLILEYIKVFGSAPRAKLQQLIEEKLSKSLTPKQKYSKVTRLLRTLSESGKIMAHGATKAAIWKLAP